ncbi:hypothetical protein E2C01_048392 [Portunus trituberculatus]|uniref:Uncharacterized protein n=1 Tax=Portunus trituberculatus TaxID=210409 RepID=A0A5B7GAW1_PORTR|nr:hypothetical protein [Portunus trituberculatus]
MCLFDEPQPLALAVSDVNDHYSCRSPEDEGQAALHFSTQWVHERRLKPDLRQRVSQKAEQKPLELPLHSGRWRTYDHVYLEKPYIALAELNLSTPQSCGAAWSGPSKAQTIQEGNGHPLHGSPWSSPEDSRHIFQMTQLSHRTNGQTY